MNLPRPKWFTRELLAEDWKCLQSRVDILIDSGQLVESARFTHKDRDAIWANLLTGECAFLADFVAVFNNALSNPIPIPASFSRVKNNPLPEDKALAEELASIIQSKNGTCIQDGLQDDFKPKDFEKLKELLCNTFGFHHDGNYIKLEDVKAFEQEEAKNQSRHAFKELVAIQGGTEKDILQYCKLGELPLWFKFSDVVLEMDKGEWLPPSSFAGYRKEIEIRPDYQFLDLLLSGDGKATVERISGFDLSGEPVVVIPVQLWKNYRTEAGYNGSPVPPGLLNDESSTTFELNISVLWAFSDDVERFRQDHPIPPDPTEQLEEQAVTGKTESTDQNQLVSYGSIRGKKRWSRNTLNSRLKELGIESIKSGRKKFITKADNARLMIEGKEKYKR